MRSCTACGSPACIGPCAHDVSDGVSHHLTSPGAVDHELDADHVALIDEDAEEEFQDWCGTNACERSACHRCFPRAGCLDHAKCREFTAAGDGYTEEGATRLGTPSA